MISRASRKAAVLIATVAGLGAWAAFFTVLREPQSPETTQPSSDSPQLLPSMQPPHVAVAGLEPDVLEAIQSAEQGVRDHPESGIAWGWLGMVSHIHGFFREACECYHQAGLLNPESFRWPYLRGLALARTNREQAVAEYRAALRLAPDETPIHVHIGELMMASGRPDEAAKHFVRATELSPTCSHAWLGRARVRMAHDDYEQALHFLDRSAEFAENHGAVYSTLARVRYRLGDVEGAERAARRAEGMKPNGNLRDGTYAALIGVGVSVQWYKHRGNRLFELGRYADACSEFSRAVNARPDIAEFRFSLGLAQTRASLLEDASKTYQKGLAIRSDDSRQLNAYGVVLCRLRRTAEGIVALQKAIRLHPNYEEAHFNLWLAMLELDRLEEAVAALQ
ncbi:MAG: tetratricopeptide repeat protein, partial [Planctomycetota bacterium]|nr:tetratricopeptide repeat protein [Planctomycetota bacterium]